VFDLGPATAALSGIVGGVRDDQLERPTPYGEATVGTLLDHVNGLSMAFTDAATKTFPPGGSQPPSADAAQLPSDWRTRIPRQLAELADAWRVESAWAGMTEAGGVDLPGEVAAQVAASEVVVHAWDLAAATGQDLTHDSAVIDAAFAFVEPTVAQNPNGRPGLFGPPVPVPDDAPPLHRLLGLTGRDPAWQPAT
jgi:uncharacterized protein (TIGR03086 family)